MQALVTLQYMPDNPEEQFGDLLSSDEVDLTFSLTKMEFYNEITVVYLGRQCFVVKSGELLLLAKAIAAALS